MVLFPVALLWLVAVVIWLARNSRNELDEPEPRRRRFVPRRPHRPGAGPRGGRARARTAAAASRRRG